MQTQDVYVRARIDAVTKKRATSALAAMGLTVSDAIRLLMLRILTSIELSVQRNLML
jgi:DNA-damage-inducible protein J